MWVGASASSPDIRRTRMPLIDPDAAPKWILAQLVSGLLNKQDAIRRKEPNEKICTIAEYMDRTLVTTHYAQHPARLQIRSLQACPSAAGALMQNDKVSAR